jgi:hypothetical protein
MTVTTRLSATYSTVIYRSNVSCHAAAFLLLTNTIIDSSPPQLLFP